MNRICLIIVINNSFVNRNCCFSLSFFVRDNSFTRNRFVSCKQFHLENPIKLIQFDIQRKLTKRKNIRIEKKREQKFHLKISNYVLFNISALVFDNSSTIHWLTSKELFAKENIQRRSVVPKQSKLSVKSVSIFIRKTKENK